MNKRRAKRIAEARILFRKSLASYNGERVPVDPRRAFDLAKEAAVLGHAEAALAVGSHYDYGIGVTRSPKRAFDWYRKSALAGNDTGRYNLATFHYLGRGTRKDYVSAVRWLRRVGREDADTAFLLGCCYEHGRGVGKDIRRAIKLYGRAARWGHAEAQVEIGFHLRDADPRKAVEWFRKGALQGSAAGQYNLAYCLEHGYGVRRSRRGARKWYRAAADQGHDRARRELRTLEAAAQQQSTAQPSRRRGTYQR